MKQFANSFASGICKWTQRAEVPAMGRPHGLGGGGGVPRHLVVVLPPLFQPLSGDNVHVHHHHYPRSTRSFLRMLYRFPVYSLTLLSDVGPVSILILQEMGKETQDGKLHPCSHGWELTK